MRLWFRKQEVKQKDKVKVSKIGRLTLALVILMVICGGGIAYFGNLQKQPLIIGVGFFLLLGSFLLFFRYRETAEARILPGGKKLAKPANALVIYEGDVEFDYIKNPPGHQSRCINLGKWYHVLTGKMGDKRTLTEFRLPDEKADKRHFDPREFSNVVTMPANKKLFEPVDSLFKTVAVGIMGIAILGLAIVILAMAG